MVKSNVMKTLFIIFILFYSLSADDIYFKQGHIVKNVKVIEETSLYITIEGTNTQYKIRKDTILRIAKNPFDPNIETELVQTDLYKYKSPTIKKEYPNLILLPVSVLSFLLSWDYFKDASDLPDTDKLKSLKTRKTIIGVGCTIIGIITAVAAFTYIEIKIQPNQISLNYNF